MASPKRIIKIAKFGIRVLKGRIFDRPYPFLVQFSVTNRCNLKCNYCYATYYKRPVEDMPIEDVKKVIDDLAKAGTFRINLVGGEPLLRNDISEIIGYIRSKGIECAMTTNGLLVPSKIEATKGLNSVCFSIDGRQQGNDLNRGTGSYEAVIRGLEACKDAGIPVQLSAVITRHTVGDVDFIVELAERYDCLAGFTTLIRQRGQENETIIASPEDTKKALMRIIELKTMGKPVLFSKKAYEYALHWPDYSLDIMSTCPDGFRPIKCYAGRYFIIIDYNTDLYPCPQLVGTFKAGNILKDGFDKAFKIAANHGCKACSVPCTNEFSMFFGLDPSVLWDQLCNAGKRK